MRSSIAAAVSGLLNSSPHPESAILVVNIVEWVSQRIFNNWKIKSASQEDDNAYAVAYTVEQKITEDKNSEKTSSTYRILLHQDNVDGNLVITQNPTLWSIPNKSDYEPQQPENNGTVDSDTVQEVTEFLETFFTFYPTAIDKELVYYVKKMPYL